MDSCPADDSDSLKPKSHCPNDVMESNKDPKVDYCGIGLWRPSCLEPLRDIRAFIAAMCFVSCLQASYSGYTSSQITTLEKRFAVGSIVIGSINSFFEVGYISCVMIVSYLGSMGRVPLWISCGLFAMSCGAFLFSVPQFLFPYNTSFSSGKSEHLCPKNIENNLSVAEETPCRSQAGGAYQFLPILLCAQFLIGAGSSPILTLAPPFVDDHVPPSKAPGMIASLYAAAALGPVFGYALGAFMLQHPMDKWSKTKILSAALTPASEDWIGLWWAGYIVLGFGVFLGACILIMFPRNLRSSFTSHKRSFENNRAGCSGVGIQSVDVELNDTNLHNLSRNTTPVAEASHPFPLHLQSSQVIHQSYRQRATSQYHHRSFSGNAPFTSTPTNIPAPVTGGTRPSIFFPTARSRHQRSASVSSILLHAAILAATASHAAEEEDEVAPTETDLSESASESDSSSPEESKRQNKWQNRLNQMTNDSQRPTHAVRSSIGRSLSLSAWQQRRWVSPSWLSRSSSSGVTQSVGGFRRRFRTPNSLGVSPPTLDVMLEDCTPEASTNPIKNLANETSDRNEFDFDVKATPIRKSQGGPKRSHPPILEGDSNQSPNSSSNPISTSSLTKPSILVHFHSHRRRRRRKIIRGRIFGFLADWSKDIPKSIFALLKNEIYVVTCLCICCEMFIVIGFAGFLPKYMEIEYQISKTTASMIAGGLIVPSGAFGILAGGLILNKARLSRKGSVIFVLCVNFVIVSCMCSFFFLGCENPKIAG
uniref:Kazal-like domain-containing protein n=1 Tax=Mesocestoides corti TaxID=53468 RepID=A0A5K3FLQ5_MESCO